MFVDELRVVPGLKTNLLKRTHFENTAENLSHLNLELKLHSTSFQSISVVATCRLNALNT